MNEKKEKKNTRLEHWKKIAIVIALYDIVAVSISYILALLIRFDFRYSMIDEIYLVTWRRFAPIYAAACVIVFFSAENRVKIFFSSASRSSLHT